MSNQDIELETVEQEHHLIMGEALERLRKNSDFQMVIVDGYLKEKALASVSLLAVPQERERRVGIMEDLIAGSNLGYWMNVVEHFYEGAKNPILSEEEEAAIAAQGGM
jgi:hypothetical protein